VRHDWECGFTERFETLWSKLLDHVVSQVQVPPLGPKEGIVARDILARLRKRRSFYILHSVIKECHLGVSLNVLIDI
jgi:hypothetical protein